MKQPSIGFCTPWCHEAGVSKIWVKGFVVSWQWFGPIPSIGCWHRFSNPGESLKSHQQKLWHKRQVKNLRNVSGLALKSGRPKKSPLMSWLSRKNLLPEGDSGTSWRIGESHQGQQISWLIIKITIKAMDWGWLGPHFRWTSSEQLTSWLGRLSLALWPAVTPEMKTQLAKGTS